MGRRVAILLDARPRADFVRGHAPGAAHLPASEWLPRAAELPPREESVAIVAASNGEAARFAEELVARGFAQAHAADAATLADRSESGPARAVAWRAASALERCASLLPARGRALDVACGSGRDVAWLAARGLSAIGVDLLPDALARARLLARAAAELAADAPMHPRGRSDFVVADAARELPLRNESLDLVCGFRYLDRGVFARARNWLAPGGFLLWQTFSVRAPAASHPRRPAFRLEPGELARRCVAAGFILSEKWEDGVQDGVLARREP